MPDLKSELEKAVSQWDKHEQTIRKDKQPTSTTMNTTIELTGNLSADIFNFIKANPGKHRGSAVADAAERLGYKRSSAHSLITQMKAAKGITLNDDGTLTALWPAYAPFDNPYKRAAKARAKAAKAAKAAKKVAKQAGIAALQPSNTITVSAAPAPRVATPLTAEYVMASINVAEAHKLYIALGQMFGGK